MFLKSRLMTTFECVVHQLYGLWDSVIYSVKQRGIILDSWLTWGLCGSKRLHTDRQPPWRPVLEWTRTSRGCEKQAKSFPVAALSNFDTQFLAMRRLRYNFSMDWQSGVHIGMPSLLNTSSSLSQTNEWTVARLLHPSDSNCPHYWRLCSWFCRFGKMMKKVIRCQFKVCLSCV